MTDDLGAVGTAQTRITVASQPPVVKVQADPMSGPAPLTVQFTGPCYDNDGTCVSASWDFGDKTASVEWDPVHTYTSPGSYTAVITGTDNSGVSSSASVVITVTE